MRSQQKEPVDLSRQPDGELLARSSWDGEAFEVFYLRHQEALVGFLKRRTGDVDIAQDLAAESFAAAYLKAASFDSEKGEARGWLFGIAKLALLGSYRRRGVERAARARLGIAVTEHRDEVWEDVEDRLDAELFGASTGLESLSRVEREAVIARILHDRDYADIASASSASEAAIRQRVSRALRRLAEMSGRASG
jgi:RNA polymerase sigma factor (sigma-70 family)